MQLADCPRLPENDPSGRTYDYAGIAWPVEYPLLRPIESSTRGKIEDLEIREPLVSDVRAIAKERENLQGSTKGVGMLCGLSPEEVESMAARDFSVLSEFLADFLS